MSRKRTDPVVRFLSFLEITESCWLWTGAQIRGYGYFQVKSRRSMRAHRFAYQLWVGPLKPGLVIHHTCYTRNCVNPDHLQQITNRENILDEGASGATRRNFAKTHCIHGHEFTPENTTHHRREARLCLTCIREYKKPDRTCDSCGKWGEHAARGLCIPCYSRFRRQNRTDAQVARDRVKDAERKRRQKQRQRLAAAEERAAA